MGRPTAAGARGAGACPGSWPGNGRATTAAPGAVASSLPSSPSAASTRRTGSSAGDPGRGRREPGGGVRGIAEVLGRLGVGHGGLGPGPGPLPRRQLDGRGVEQRAGGRPGRGRRAGTGRDGRPRPHARRGSTGDPSEQRLVLPGHDERAPHHDQPRLRGHGGGHAQLAVHERREQRHPRAAAGEPHAVEVLRAGAGVGERLGEEVDDPPQRRAQDLGELAPRQPRRRERARAAAPRPARRRRAAPSRRARRRAAPDGAAGRRGSWRRRPRGPDRRRVAQPDPHATGPRGSARRRASTAGGPAAARRRRRPRNGRPVAVRAAGRHRSARVRARARTRRPRAPRGRAPRSARDVCSCGRIHAACAAAATGSASRVSSAASPDPARRSTSRRPASQPAGWVRTRWRGRSPRSSGPARSSTPASTAPHASATPTTRVPSRRSGSSTRRRGVGS